MAVAIAYPFIEVKIVPPPTPIAQRAPGVIAVVGKTPAGADGGAATANTPMAIESAADAAELFAKKNADGSVAATTLYSSLVTALQQDPRPSKIYGVRVANDEYAAALSSLEAADDVTFVGLANEVALGAPAAGAAAPTGLHALKDHVERMSADGQRRIGVAMLDPAAAKSTTYVQDRIAALTAPNTLKSDNSRMIVVAARGAKGDAATAAMSAIAGQEPHISIVLKKLRGVSMPVASQYSPREIKGLAEAGIIPIIDPALIVGESLHFAEGVTFTSDASKAHIDLVRTIDDIEFRLKAGLIGMIGDARITKGGLTTVKTRVEAILEVQQRRSVIDGFTVVIPVLDILSLPETARTAGENMMVTTARETRVVEMIVTITYGPAVSRLRVSLVTKF